MAYHPSDLTDIRLLTKALAFAAGKHRHQRRKDEYASPYINHPIQLMDVLSGIGKIEDIPTLVAALLHDTIEDTHTSFEELKTYFGNEIANIVMEVSDDPSLSKEGRRQQLVEKAPAFSRKAKLVKLADLITNINDVLFNDSVHWTLEQRRAYLEWANNVAAGLRGTSPALEAKFDSLYALRSEMELKK